MLGVMGDNRAVDPLIRTLNIPGYQAQLYAAEALGKLGSARAITPLLEVANDSSRDKVRTAAKTALTKLGWQNDIIEPVQPAPQDEPQNGSRVAEEI